MPMRPTETKPSLHILECSAVFHGISAPLICCDCPRGGGLGTLGGLEEVLEVSPGAEAFPSSVFVSKSHIVVVSDPVLRSH
jgi:hypothetical protein